MNRLHQLDYLRGLAAFGIMIYHFLFWSVGAYESDSFLGRVGVYGVSIFYVLSGLTLHYVYIGKLHINRPSLTAFAKKRFFRIFPLLWLATIGSIVLMKQIPALDMLFLNLTGLFGLLDWDSYYANGAWSIGNELVFYLLFPLFIWLVVKYKYGWMPLFVVFFALYLYFSCFVLDEKITLEQQWRDYVNPLNQAFLFLCGFLTGHFLKETKVGNWLSLGFILLGTGFFLFYPVKGNTIALVTDFNRIWFTLACVLICIGFFKSKLSVPVFVHKPLSLLGEASYSVYMLHPLVYSLVFIVNKRIFHLSTVYFVVLAISTTLVVSYFTYNYMEKYFMRLGKGKSLK